MSARMSEIRATVAEIIAQRFSFDASLVNSATTADKVRGWDSLSHAMLIMEVEEKFNIAFDDNFVFAVANVGELCDKIAELTGG